MGDPPNSWLIRENPIEMDSGVGNPPHGYGSKPWYIGKHQHGWLMDGYSPNYGNRFWPIPMCLLDRCLDTATGLFQTVFCRKLVMKPMVMDPISDRLNLIEHRKSYSYWVIDILFDRPWCHEFLETELGQLGIDFQMWRPYISQFFWATHVTAPIFTGILDTPHLACEVRINDLAAPPVAEITGLMCSGDENHWLFTIWWGFCCRMLQNGGIQVKFEDGSKPTNLVDFSYVFPAFGDEDPNLEGFDP